MSGCQRPARPSCGAVSGLRISAVAGVGSLSPCSVAVKRCSRRGHGGGSSVGQGSQILPPGLCSEARRRHPREPQLRRGRCTHARSVWGLPGAFPPAPRGFSAGSEGARPRHVACFAPFAVWASRQGWGRAPRTRYGEHLRRWGSTSRDCQPPFLKENSPLSQKLKCTNTVFLGGCMQSVKT